MKENARTIAARIIDAVITQQRSLSDVASGYLDKLTDPRERRLAQELSYGVLRKFQELDKIIGFLLQKPLKKRDGLVKALLLSGAYQIYYLRTPEHAAVSGTVDAAKKLGSGWARGLINGSLRNLIRQSDTLRKQAHSDESARYQHPAWMIKKLKHDWPEDWEAILDASQQLAPMNLRVNARRGSREDYLILLQAEAIEASLDSRNLHGIRLARTHNPTTLPGFTQGHVSVQDSAAQLAAGLLDLQAEQRVLDICAAPGGKTAHILESQPALASLLSIDLVESRVALIRQTLTRLHLDQANVTVLQADALESKNWWNGHAFDRILLDAPCSATGVIRRHPDIKLHRKPHDIEKLIHTQAQILDQSWSLLASGGRLVYVTCSVFNDENRTQIAQFLQNHSDAREVPIDADWGRSVQPGRQILPGEEGMDGFYYACLEKTQ